MNKHIDINPQVLAGKPVIKGTRIPVTLILNLFANGYDVERIIKAYPNLNKEQIKSAVEYSENRINREEIIPNKNIAIA